MFVRAWQFRAAKGKEREFERVYGPHGEWVQLFAVSDGYIATELLKATDDSGDYLILDRWASMEAWERFHREHAHVYGELERRHDDLIRSETLIGEYSDSTAEQPAPE